MEETLCPEDFTAAENLLTYDILTLETPSINIVTDVFCLLLILDRCGAPTVQLSLTIETITY